MIALDYLFSFLAYWALRGVRSWRRTRIVAQAKTWPQARPLWRGEITCSYVVDGEYYSGLEWLPAEDEAHAEGLVLGWKDHPLVVRYCPKDVASSALLLEDQNVLGKCDLIFVSLRYNPFSCAKLPYSTILSLAGGSSTGWLTLKLPNQSWRRPALKSR